MDYIGESICAKSSRLPRRKDEILYNEDTEDEEDLADEVD